MIHCLCKERKSCARDGSYESVDGNGAVGIETVAVDDVVDTLPGYCQLSGCTHSGNETEADVTYQKVTRHPIPRSAVAIT